MNLKNAPFNLNESDIDWVNQTLESMSLDEKIGQVFLPIGFSTNEQYLTEGLLRMNIGGVMFRDAPMEDAYAANRFLQENSKIPLFLAANLEYGGNGVVSEGTFYGSQMQVAATGISENAYRLGLISNKEAAAVGCNYAFAPVVDIDMNYHNPITNVRTYGSDPQTVLQYGREYIRAAKEVGNAVAIKHFPGDGVDERDQHILTSVNSLSTQEWDETYGKVYKGLIEEGVLTVMVGHIAMPAYQKVFNPDFGNKVLPASLSPELLRNLLRDKLGFEGMVITDASIMVGFCSAMDRETAIPTAIAAGCDMILFNLDLMEDITFLKRGIEKGIVTEERLDEAVMRILATKAALALHIKQANGTLVPSKDSFETIGCKKHRKWAKECADESVTLVKDTQNLLPLNSREYKRVLLEIIGDCDSNSRVQEYVKNKLEREGFEVTVYTRETLDVLVNMNFDNASTIREKYNLVVYIGNIENASNKTTNRINWYTFFGAGNNIPWFVKEVPTLFISLANPYHLLDVPMIETYINCYSNSELVIDACIEKIMGRSAFQGRNPVDPFCGREELAY